MQEKTALAQSGKAQQPQTVLEVLKAVVQST